MKDYGTWKGTPRDQIPWFPSIDSAKCAGCRKCVEFCTHGVYGWDDAADSPIVAEPYRCVVGCSNCSYQCEEGAIAFPPLSVLKPFIPAS